MLINTFTLIDAFNQFWTACEDGDRRALSCAGLTYFYLCRVWNATGRSISFRRQNTLICAELLISKPTLERHRNVLKQYGLINFYSKGKGDPNIIYTILDLNSQSEEAKQANNITYKVTEKENNITTEEVKKANNITSGVTSPVTSGDAYKQSKSKEEELFVEVLGEVKKYYFLKNLFETDAGLQMNYKQKGLPPGNFSDAILQWMIQNHGSKYTDFDKARKHFLFWMPNYQPVNEKSNEPKPAPGNRKTIAKPGKADLDYAAGL